MDRAIAQTGATFTEFSAKLEPYFAAELIEDVKAAMPQGSDFRVWSWDVGDFSGDGYNDLAFAVRLLGDKRKTMQVFLFTDEEGFLNNVEKFTVPYVELPLEVGVAIKENACYITEKQEQFHWTVRSYRYVGGSVVQVDEFTTSRANQLTRETYRNFLTLEASEKFLPIGSGDALFVKKYYTMPSYARGRQIYRGYSAGIDVHSIDYVLNGAYYWTGQEDCSFVVRTAYDEQFLYMTFNVRDDEVIPGRCDTCTADYIEIWLNSNPPEEPGKQILTEKRQKRGKAARKKEQVEPQNVADSGLYGIIIRPGDFLEKSPSFSIITTDDMEPQQKAASAQIKVSAAPRTGGYVVKVRIPFMLIGFQQAPVEQKEILPLGCTVVVHDSDNEFRPEEEARLATSPLTETEASTYGTVMLIPESLWYGVATNLYSEQLLKYLSESGF